MRNDREEATKAINHLFHGGIIEMEDKYIYLDDSNNLKALMKHEHNEEIGYELCEDSLSKREIISILGIYDNNFCYKLINYNGLTINKFIRIVINEKKGYLKLI